MNGEYPQFRNDTKGIEEIFALCTIVKGALTTN